MSALETLAILRRDAVERAAWPEGLVADPLGPLWRVQGPAVKPRGFTLRRRRDSLLAQVAARQARLEALMPLGPVLACPPGVSLSIDALLPHVADLSLWLDRLVGRVQFQVQIFWDRDAARGRFADQLRDGSDAALDQLAAQLAAQMWQGLAPVALDAEALPREGPEMLLNRVLLLRAQEEMRLDQAIEAIDALWPEGLRLRLVGPSPAVSFALLTPAALPLEEVTTAAQDLGLPLDLPVTGAGLAALAPSLPHARRQRLMQGGDASSVTMLERVCALDLPAGEIETLILPQLRREGCADPVAVTRLPPPDSDVCARGVA